MRAPAVWIAESMPAALALGICLRIVPRGDRSRRMSAVSKRKTRDIDLLTRRIANLDASSIDRLYGLEPVYEPGAGLPGLLPEEFVAIRCPYCGERLETRVDLTADEGAYIEDCQVCCRPIELSIEREDSGALRAVRVQRLD